MSKELKSSGNVAIFSTDLALFNAAFASQKKIANEKGVASYGKQAFLGRCLREVLPHIQGVIFEQKTLITDDKSIG